MTRRIPLKTVAGATFKDIYYRIASDMGGPARAIRLRGGRPEPFFDIKPSLNPGQSDFGIDIMRGHFEYAGQKIDVGAQGDPWTIALPSERFAKWLHSFSWIEHLAAVEETPAYLRGRFLFDRWIEIYGKWNPYCWDNDILAPRLYMLLAHWSPMFALDKLTEKGLVRRANTVRQLKRLRNTYKRTPPGILRFQAAATIALGGARLSERSDGFLDRGLDWLDDEIDAQILPDGGHVSRSPEQTLKALEILLTLDEILNRRGVEGSRAMGRAIDRLMPAAASLRASDGSLVSFHGGQATHRARIEASFAALPKPPKAVTHLPHTGFHRIDRDGTILIMDVGGTPPGPFDTEAHLAPLAFEVSTEAGRLMGNCGWTDGQPGPWRRPMRSSAAHTTLTLSDQSPGELLKSGFAARRVGNAIAHEAGPARSARKDQPEGTWLEAAHDGYLREFGLTHTRRLYMSEDGKDIRGEDSLSLPSGAAPIRRDECPFDIRFHLHPDVKVTLAQDQKSALLIQPGMTGWRFRTDTGPLTIEESAYLAEGHRPVKCEQIVISGTAYCDSDGSARSNRVRWSLRRLEAKSA